MEMKSTNWVIEGNKLACTLRCETCDAEHVKQVKLVMESAGRIFTTATLVALEIPEFVLSAFPPQKEGNAWFKKIPKTKGGAGHVSFRCEWEYGLWPEEMYGKPL
jgi:hypothetical protein